MSKAFPTENEMRAQCKESCLAQLKHHRRCIGLDDRLLSAEEVSGLIVLYDKFYDAALALLEEK